MVSGRYLSGYLALREKAEGFLDLCFDAKRAPEITRSRSAVSVSTRVFSDRASTLLTVVTIGRLVPSELELCQQQHDDGWGAFERLHEGFLSTRGTNWPIMLDCRSCREA